MNRRSIFKSLIAFITGVPVVKAIEPKSIGRQVNFHYAKYGTFRSPEVEAAWIKDNLIKWHRTDENEWVAEMPPPKPEREKPVYFGYYYD
mgnify:CR=1 FL=1